ncbi:hypothetical protein B0H11DRAFT_1799785 [Mycena galericulata]|nr:hypothetical protein B0H11DRAFT_1799785 [Mycena galericulata]
MSLRMLRLAQLVASAKSNNTQSNASRCLSIPVFTPGIHYADNRSSGVRRPCKPRSPGRPSRAKQYYSAIIADQTPACLE